MLVTELLMHLTRVFFVLLAITTVTDYMRHPDRIRRDIALMFVALSSSIVIGLLLSLFNITLPILLKIGQIGVISQPYLLLRLVAYFRSVPRSIKLGAAIGWAISCFAVIFVGTPLPTIVTLPIIIYFIVINGYAAIAFIQGAFSSAGVARHRLRFAAVASALLIGLFLIAGIRLLLPKTSPDVNAAVQLLSVLTVMTYYLGFAPPRWLRQSWQFVELRKYLLQDISKPDNQSVAYVLVRLRDAVIRALGSDMVFIALWDGGRSQLVLEDTPAASPLATFNLNDGIIQRVWKADEPTIVTSKVDLDLSDRQLMQSLDAEALFIVPIATKETPLGVLLVFLEYGSLFVDDDLSLLTIFAQQTAILLENTRILEEQRRYAQILEHTVQERTQALKRSNDELRQFAYVASHDLQEPLRMIVSYLQLIEDRYISQLDKDAREFIDFAVNGAKQMKSLIEALLAYSRVETTIQNFTPVDFQHVLDDVFKLLKVSIEESGTTVSHDVMPKMSANEAMMIQLFQNLISNAIKYQKGNKPKVHIGAAQQDQEWVFSVKDNGIGIEAKDLERIFIIFQRLHARNEYPGTGIGLAVCKKVVEHHGGRIWAESTAGQGTTFYFTIPTTIRKVDGQALRSA